MSHFIPRSISIRGFLVSLPVSAAMLGMPADANASIWTKLASGNATGTWSTSSNWTGGVPDAPDATADFSTLDISATSIVTLGSPATLGTMVFGDTNPTNNWRVNGSTITFEVSSGSPTIAVNNQLVTLNSVLAGSGGLTKVGPGTAVFGSANIYSGGTTISDGTLKFNNAAALGTGTVTFSAVSTLQAGGAYTIANPINIDPGVTGTIDTNGNATSLSGALTGSGNLTKIGSGTLTLTGAAANTLSGTIHINGGTLKCSDGTSFLNMTGAVKVVSGATFNFGQNFLPHSLTNSLDLSGTGVSGSTFGALNLHFNATASGPITLNGNTTITHDFNNATISGNISGAGHDLQLTTLTADQPGLVVSGAIQTGAGGVIVTGTANSGTYSVQLSGMNTFTGGLTINNGVVLLNSPGALNSTIGLENAVTFGAATTSGRLTLNGRSYVVSNLTSNATPGTPVVQNASSTPVTLTIGNSRNLSGTYAGVIQDGSPPVGSAAALALAKIGSGILTLSGTNSYTGGTSIYAGILALGHATNTLSDTGVVTISGGTLDLGAHSDAIGALAMTGGTISGSGSLLAASLDLQNGSVSAVLGGNGTVTKNSSGTITLSAPNTYTGLTQVNAGILTFANTAAKSGGTTVTAAAGATIGLGVGISGGGFTAEQVADLFNSSATVNSSGLGITLATGGTSAASASVAIDTSLGNFTLSSPLTAARNLTKLGANTLTLAAGLGNTFSGGINVYKGRLSVTDGISLKNVTGRITVATGASFNYGQNFTSNNLTNAMTLEGPGDGTYGALNLGYNAVSTGSITLESDTTISHDWNIGTITGNIAGTNVDLTLASTVFGQSPLTVNGDINLGTGTLLKTGPNSVTLNGTNSCNNVLVNNGALYFQKDAAMGGTGANITIAPGAVAVRNGTALSSLLARVNPASAGAIAFGGAAGATSTDTLDLTGHPLLSVGAYVDTIYNGIISPDGGAYRLGGGGASLTVNSSLSGSSGLIIHDTQGGTVNLAGAHTFTGATIINSGTLRVDGSMAGDVSVSNSGTLAPGPATGIGRLNLSRPLTVNGTLHMRIDRANSQKSDLLTVPSLTLGGYLVVVNEGDALRNGDAFQLFSVTGSITRSNATLSLPTLASGLAWDFAGLLVDGTLKVVAFTNTTGDPNWPDLLPAQLQAIRDAGYPSATINPGTYNLPEASNTQSSFQLSSWSDFTIHAENVLFIVGKQRTFTLSNCSNVTIKGVTIRARYPSFTQGRVLSKGINSNGKAYAIWRISDGYPTAFKTDGSYVSVNPNELKSASSFNAVNQITGLIDLATGDNYSSIVTDQGDNTWKIDFPSRTSLPFNVNDWLVTRLQDADSQGYAVYLNNSTNCTIESVTSQSGGFATIFEIGGGGNHLLSCRIEPSPAIPPGGTELPLVSCAADGVHTRDTYPGLHVEDCVFTGVLLDDCIAIHGVYRNVLSVAGNAMIYDDGDDTKVSGAGKFVVGDPVRISAANGFFAQATCTDHEDLGGGDFRLAIDQTLSIPVGAQVSSPKYNGDGFRIINSQLGGTRSRVIITKADNGTISGCTLQHSGTAIKIGPEYYWDESDYSWNVTVEDNIIDDCTLGIQVEAEGAIGNKNIVIRNNMIGTITKSFGISLNGCDGATISGNDFAPPTAAVAINFKNSTNIILANNLVAYAPGGKNMLSMGSDVSSVQGAANGLLYSGRAYAFTNSLSGLLLANPFSNAAGASVQQYSNCNASGRWILQPDGNGYCHIVSAANGLLLGVNNTLTTSAPLVLEPVGAGDGQRWTLAPVGASAVGLVNKLSGLVATVNTANLSETVTQLAGTSGAGQLWTPAFMDYSYATWRTSSGASADPLNDDDHDGLNNLLEYALASSPATAGRATTGSIISQTADGQTHDFLSLAIKRRVAATDIYFQVEYSTDLSAWTANAELVSATSNPDGTSNEIWRSPTPVGEGSGFLRVRVKTTD